MTNTHDEIIFWIYGVKLTLLNLISLFFLTHFKCLPGRLKFLHGSHYEMGFPGGSDSNASALNAGDPG